MEHIQGYELIDTPEVRKLRAPILSCLYAYLNPKGWDAKKVGKQSRKTWLGLVEANKQAHVR